ncbi:SDR family NAD(P)-dependent oxidoreductase [Psychrosphaera sp. F3M07]|uniref:SDR family NAD(P)-dependent oxidoreductase n=1 Tax=Psychrosphaera sp. F3M07 TaxID=2841560 RepID=UPI001C0950C7|nr:SDR family NAD(P)-dependent oxidoreductase [Psychrosphaera sp. F3M07]MBU2917222.1 SDR family NAD(P)-dependent oxidoreductase [Psychrosphaera sp. F3M07]
MQQKNRKYALVTGASNGIGLALTKQLLLTHRVIAISRTAGELAQLPSTNLTHWVYDLSINNQRLKLLEHVKTEIPHLDLLINNAGIQLELTLEDLNWDSHQYEVALNLMAPIHLSLGLENLLLKAPNPKIINMGSVLGFSHRKVSPMYSITKSAFHRFSQILHTDHKNINVLEIIPPMVATDMTKKRGHEGLLKPDNLAKIIISKINKTGVIYVGKAKLAKWLYKLAPTTLSKLMNKGN